MELAYLNVVTLIKTYGIQYHLAMKAGDPSKKMIKG